MKSISGCRKAFLWGAAAMIMTIASSAGILCQRNALAQTAPLKLDQVVVSATKTEHTLGDVPVAAEVITREEIEQKQIQTVQEALLYIPGVKINQTSSSWGDKGKVQMQGLDEKHTLILVDGQRFIGGHGDAVDIQSIPIEMVERIEVVKGPASALYGSDAVGGVVNIIMKSPSQKPTFSTSTAFGSRETKNYNATGGYNMGGFGSLLTYTYRESDGVSKETDQYREQIFQGSLGYEFTPDSKLTVKPYYSSHKMTCQGRVQDRAGVNSTWEWAPDTLSKLVLRGSLFDYKHYTRKKSTDWDSGAYESEVTYSRLLFDRHMVTGGYQYFTEKIDDRGKKYRNDQSLHSLYAQTELRFQPLAVVLGTRVDRHDRWGAEVNPKISVLLKLTNDIKVRGSVGTAFKGPSLPKLYADNWKMGPYTVYANPNLKPEKSIGYQLGVEYAFLERFLGKLSFFRNDITDMINYKVVARKMYWINVDQAITEGVELSLASQLTKALTARAGYTFLRTEDKISGRDLTYRPKHKATLELNQKFAAIGLNINIVGEYIGQRLDSNYKELEGYSLCNVAITQDIGRHFQLYARANNIFGVDDIADDYDLDGARYSVGLQISF